jgi:hypothetical protein
MVIAAGRQRVYIPIPGITAITPFLRLSKLELYHVE